MTITELRYIVALAKENHFGRAAARAHVSQPTLSIGVKKLEEELGIPLFERLSGKVIPTKVGEKIISIAEETLASTDVIRSIAQQAKGDMVGNVKLGIIYSMCPYMLPKLIPALQDSAPDLNLKIEEGFTNTLIDGLKDGTLDLAITSLPLEKSTLLSVEEVMEEPFVVILPEGHPLTAKEALSFHDLVTEKVFILGKGNCFAEQVVSMYEAEVSARELTKSDFIVGGSLETIRVLVKANMGISVFPSMAIGEHNSEGLVVRPFVDPVPFRKIALVYRQSFVQADVVTAVIESVKRCL